MSVNHWAKAQRMGFIECYNFIITIAMVITIANSYYSLDILEDFIRCFATIASMD